LSEAPNNQINNSKTKNITHAMCCLRSAQGAIAQSAAQPPLDAMDSVFLFILLRALTNEPNVDADIAACDIGNGVRRRAQNRAMPVTPAR
jgi:hypothetical protein